MTEAKRGWPKEIVAAADHDYGIGLEVKGSICDRLDFEELEEVARRYNTHAALVEAASLLKEYEEAHSKYCGSDDFVFRPRTELLRDACLILCEPDVAAALALATKGQS